MLGVVVVVVLVCWGDGTWVWWGGGNGGDGGDGGAEAEGAEAGERSRHPGRDEVLQGGGVAESPDAQGDEVREGAAPEGVREDVRWEEGRVEEEAVGRKGMRAPLAEGEDGKEALVGRLA